MKRRLEILLGNEKKVLVIELKIMVEVFFEIFDFGFVKLFGLVLLLVVMM